MRRRRARVGNRDDRGHLRNLRSGSRCRRGNVVTLPPESVLATFPRRRNGREAEVRVQLARLPDGTPLLQIRRWYRLDSGEWRPTREGVAIKANELRDLEGAVRGARDVLNGESPTTLRGDRP